MLSKFEAPVFSQNNATFLPQKKNLNYLKKIYLFLFFEGGFKEFAEIFPEYCVNKSVVERKNFQCESEDQQQSEIENAKMTEITPYLYLGIKKRLKKGLKRKKEQISKSIL